MIRYEYDIVKRDEVVFFYFSKIYTVNSTLELVDELVRKIELSVGDFRRKRKFLIVLLFTVLWPFALITATYNESVPGVDFSTLDGAYS